jgi:type I restriction enzyme S subunit
MIKRALSELAEITMGQSPSGKYCGVNVKGIPLLNGPAEFTEYYPIPVQYTSDPKKLSKVGDILFCVRGSTTGRMNWSNGEYAIGRGLAALSHKKGKEYNHFLKYLISNNLDALLNNTNGSTFPNITSDLLASFSVYVPGFDIQIKISKLLSAIDAKIELNNRINTELEAMAKSLYDYWFVQFDFPDANGKPYKSSGGKMVYNPALKREIPDGWEAGTASTLLDFNPTTSLKTGAVASYIDMDSLPVNGFMTKIPARKKFAGGVKFKNNDVAVARITPCLENGKTALISRLSDNEVGFGSTEFIILRGKKRTLPCFSACLARLESFRRFAILNMTGTSGRKRIDAKILETYSLPIPDKALLDEFESKVDPLFKKMNSNAEENDELAKLRDWLLPMFMNGQVTVK